MERAEVIEQLVPIMADIFDDDDITYDDALTADDVAEWDSLSHIRFVIAVERKFRIRFSTSEIEQFKTLGDLVTAVAERA